MTTDCKECNGDNWKLLGCCSGFECGCQGLPVDAIPCPLCNHHGEKEPSEQAVIDWPYFFDPNWCSHESTKEKPLHDGK